MVIITGTAFITLKVQHSKVSTGTTTKAVCRESKPFVAAAVARRPKETFDRWSRKPGPVLTRVSESVASLLEPEV